MKITKQHLEESTDQMQMLEFWRSDPAFIAAVQAYLARICPHVEALEWLTAALVNHVGKWPGPHEVRGLLCTRYDAADGVDAHCSVPGFSPADFERKHIERHESIMGRIPTHPFRGLGDIGTLKQLLPADDGLQINYEVGCATCGAYPTIGETEQCQKCADEASKPSRPQRRQPNPLAPHELQMLRAEAQSDNPETARLAQELLRKHEGRA